MISDFYNSNFITYRKVIQANNQDAETPVTSGVGFLHFVSDKSQLYNQANYGREYRFYCDQSHDVKNNDILAIGSDRYKISGGNNVQDPFDGSDEFQRMVAVKNPTTN